MPEAIVSLVIAALMAATCFPAVLHHREIARQRTCSSNLKNIGGAIWAHRGAWGLFPNNLLPPYQLLPYLPPDDAHPWKPGVEPDDTTPGHPVWRCPTDEMTHNDSSRMSYCWSTGSGTFSDHADDGFVGDRRLSVAHFTDGTSHTAAASETRVFIDDLVHVDRTTWAADKAYSLWREREAFRQDCATIPLDERHSTLSQRGTKWLQTELYDHLFSPNSRSCESSALVGESGFAKCYAANSEHPGGVHLLLVDGSVRFISDSIDLEVWSALSTRAGSETIDW